MAEIDRIQSELRKRETDPLLGYATLHSSTLRAGIGWRIIPVNQIIAALYIGDPFQLIFFQAFGHPFGFKIPQGFYLHPGHTWVKIEEGSMVRVGLDDFAMRLLGPLDRIEAPLMGKQMEQDRTDISLTREGNDAKLLSPVSGVVMDINPDLRQKGSRADQDPYSEGWTLRLDCTNLCQDLKNLMIGDQTGEFIDEEVDRLYQMIEETAGPLAADGGYLGDDIFGNLPQSGCQKLTQLFLRT